MSARDDDATRRARGPGSPGLDATLPASARGSLAPAEGMLAELSPGATIGRYVVGETLGRGGMGVVYRARDPDLDRELAIKFVLPPLAGRRSQERLLAEARAMAKLRHPSVVPVFDVGVTERGVYLVMPLVAGGTLHDWMAAAPRPWREVVARFVAAGRGLAAAHAAGVIHRDFKPRNVLVDERGDVLVADFGLAGGTAPAADGRDAVATSIAGTPAYMAPEQAAGAVVDARADQYSFCISFWEALHGRRPTAAETERASMAAGSTEAATPPDPAVHAIAEVALEPGREAPPTWLQLAVARGFSPEAERRWPSMEALLEEIETRIRAGTSSGLGRVVRMPIVWVAAGATGIAAVLLTTGALRGDSDGKSDRGAATGPGSAVGEPEVRATSAPRQLTRSGGCVYAPVFLDDRRVAFDLTPPGAGPDVYTLELPGGRPNRITEAATWEWRAGRGLTPGELLYLVTDLKQSDQSYMAARDLGTGVERRLATGSGAAIAAARNAYYYLRTDGVELRSLRDGVDEQVITLSNLKQAQSLAPSPDGRSLAVTGWLVGGAFGACLVDLDDKTETCPTTHELVTGSRVEFGPSGDLYLAARDGIFARRSTGEERLVVPGVRAYGGVAVSPDGKTLVYSDCTALGAIRNAGVTPAIVLSEEERLSDPIAGPDGRIAWLRGRRELFMRATDGTVRDLLGPGKADEPVLTPAFDDSGGQIAFSRGGRQAGIWVADADRAAPTRQLTFNDGDVGPLFLHDGSLVFSREHEGSTHVFRVMPGQEPVLISPRPRITVDVDRKAGRVLLRSPDQRFLYWWDPITGQEQPGPPTYIAGTTFTRDISIAPDGAWMLYQSGPFGHDLWRTRTDAWKPELVFTAPDESTMESSAITSEGHPLVLEKRWHGELFAVDALRGTF